MTRHTLDSDSEADVAALAAWLEKTFGPDVAAAGHPDPMTTTDWRYLAEKALAALPASPPLIDRERLAEWLRNRRVYGIGSPIQQMQDEGYNRALDDVLEHMYAAANEATP